jgi:hypothetical protein
MHDKYCTDYLLPNKVVPNCDGSTSTVAKATGLAPSDANLFIGGETSDYSWV